MIDITTDGYLVVMGPGDADSGQVRGFDAAEENALTSAVLQAKKNGGQPVRVYRVQMVSEVRVPLGQPEWEHAG